MEGITVLPAQERDSGFMAELHGDLFSDGWSQGDFLTFIRNDCDLVFVARDDESGLVAGFIVLRVVLDEAEVLTIGVSGDYQKRGIGLALCEFAESVLLKNGVGRLFLELRISNRAAAALYEKAGFGLVAKRKGYYRSGDGSFREDALIMKKTL